MDELQSQELEELVQELEEESGAQKPPQAEAEELLQVLQTGSSMINRRDAATGLGGVATSSPRIVRALVAAYESDPASSVNSAAARSLGAPVHREYLQECPDLLAATETALQQRPGADRQVTDSDTGRVRARQGAGNPLWSGIFHDHRWRWAPIYGLALVAATSLVFIGSGSWTFLAAGVVWLAGGVIGLVILWRKGHSVGGVVSGVLELVDDTSGCLLVVLALFALVGPMVLLAALLVRPKGSIVGMSKPQLGAKASGRRKPGPVHEREQPLDCPTCGACNSPGREYCDECGAGLRGAAVGSTRTPESRATARTEPRRPFKQRRVNRSSTRKGSLSCQLGAALGAWFVRARRSLRKRLASGVPGEPTVQDTLEVSD